VYALEQTGAGNRARVDGGGGTDTLKLEGAGLTLDLTKISDRHIQDIEVIDITGSGDNTLKLNLDDLLDASTSTNILKVLGDSGDKVNAAGFRARLPAPVCSNAVILLALMMMSSLPKPALNTSIPPLPVRISLPAPATNIS
jgi:hypothetical protein